MRAVPVPPETPTAIEQLPPELFNIVQLMSATYESIDVRFQTTLASAEQDFCDALPEMKGHDVELSKLLAVLIDDLRDAHRNNPDQGILVHFAFDGEEDLASQLFSNLRQTDKIT